GEGAGQCKALSRPRSAIASTRTPSPASGRGEARRREGCDTHGPMELHPAPCVIPGSGAHMNEHVKRPAKVERTDFGLTLTDVHPLSGIPAVWRLAAMISTLVMGFLAMIAALYFGRAALLPVVAALVVGITLSPVTEFGRRFNIPPPVSAVTLIVGL